MIRLDQDLFNFNFIYFNNFQINNNRKSLTMKNFLIIVSVYVGAFFQLSVHVWPIFDCYSNMPLFVYRIRDVILELHLNNISVICEYLCTTIILLPTNLITNYYTEYTSQSVGKSQISIQQKRIQTCSKGPSIEYSYQISNGFLLSDNLFFHMLNHVLWGQPSRLSDEIG